MARRRFRIDPGWLLVGVVAALVVIAFSVALGPGATGSGHRQAVGVGLLFSLACFAVASVVGFLFGVPRSATTDSGPPTSDILPNTNLEQVSDWLTKLLLGATLTQVGRIRDGFLTLSRSVGGSLGTTSGAEVAGSLLALAAALGFLAGWLIARLWLGRAMRDADKQLIGKQLLIRADEASAAGATADATALARAAGDLMTESTSRATLYDALRTGRPSSPSRTRELQDIVDTARASAVQAGDTLTRSDVVAMFEGGTPGMRIQALAAMQARLDLIDVPSLTRAIGDSRSAFEQYQALLVARDGLRGGRFAGDEGSAEALATTVRTLLDSGVLDGTHDRRRLAEELADQLAR